MPMFRFMLPLVVVLSYMLYLMLPSAVSTSPAVLASTVIILFLSTIQPFVPGLKRYGEDGAAYTGTIVGKYISKAWPSGSLVALCTAGATPYYATQHRYIDMLG